MEVKITKEFWCSCGKDVYPYKHIKIKRLHTKGNFKSYLHTVLCWCCKDMKQAFDDYIICCGEYMPYGMNKDKNVNLVETTAYDSGTV